MKRTIKQENSECEDRRARLTAMFEKAQNILKTANGGIKLRSTLLFKSLKEKEDKIRTSEYRHSAFKETVVSYHKNYIEKNKSEEHAFITALEKYDLDGSSFKEILNQQMNTCKRQRIDDLSKLTNNKENSFLERNTTVSGLSPIAHLKRTAETSLLPNNISQSIFNQSAMSSPISSINSSIISSKHTTKDDVNSRFKLNHTLNQDVIFKKHCSTCCLQDSKMPMYKCTNCGLYIHDFCRQPRICISLNKVSTKIVTEGCLTLKKLCGNTILPMVPNIFLIIIYRIHTFGLSTPNIYKLEYKDKEVKDLCNKTLSGQLKYLIRVDITMVSSVLLMLLKNLSAPLISNSVMNKIKSQIDMNGSINWEGIGKSLNELSKEALDTTVYILLHLKVIANSAPCNLTSEKLANIFTRFFAGNCNVKSIQAIIMLIDLDIIFYDKYFITELDFFGQYFKELQRKELTV